MRKEVFIDGIKYVPEVLPVSEPVKERVIIVDIGFSHNNQFGNWYSFSTKSELHPDEYLSIKQAIESALNDTVVEDAKHLPKDIDVELFKLARDNEALKSLLEQMTNYAENWKGLHVKLYNDYADLVAKSIGKTFTQSEVDAIRADTWYAARKITDKVVGEIDFKDGDRCPFYEKYFNSINDYLSSLNLNSNDTGKEDNETKSANWRSENLSKQSAPEPSALPNKEWEIVSFVSIHGEVLTLDEKKWKYRSETSSISDMDFLLKHYSIHSVRRLKDSEVFQIGDKIGWGIHDSYETTLLAFEIQDGRLKFNDSERPEHCKWADFLNAVNLHKKPITDHPTQPVVEDKPYPLMLKTVDGKDIYLNDIFWYVGDAWNVCETSLPFYEEWKCLLKKSFSTKEAAEQFCLKNKPSLSLNDVTNFLHKHFMFDTEYYEALKEIAKQKLSHQK